MSYAPLFDNIPKNIHLLFCSSLLINDLYMDNFLYSCFSIDKMKDIFHQTTSHMKEGGFDLCYWNSNNLELRDLFKLENKISTHQCSEERVLGYLFHLDSDTFPLSNLNFDDVVM